MYECSLLTQVVFRHPRQYSISISRTCAADGQSHEARVINGCVNTEASPIYQPLVNTWFSQKRLYPMFSSFRFGAR